MRSVPGGPFDGERKLDPDIERNLRARYGLDDDLHLQYFRGLGRYCRGDFGVSMKLRDFSIMEIVRQGFPISASLGILALVFALSFGVLTGATAAIRRGKPLDTAVMSFATIGIALPEFIVAALAIILFVFVIAVFPAGGWGSWQQSISPRYAWDCRTPRISRG